MVVSINNIAPCPLTLLPRTQNQVRWPISLNETETAVIHKILKIISLNLPKTNVHFKPFQSNLIFLIPETTQGRQRSVGQKKKKNTNMLAILNTWSDRRQKATKDGQVKNYAGCIFCWWPLRGNGNMATRDTPQKFEIGDIVKSVSVGSSR